jgi:hypothetical protein
LYILCFTAGYKAESQCFERFNPTGNFNGHCGKDDKTGSYAKCLPEYVHIASSLLMSNEKFVMFVKGS